MKAICSSVIGIAVILFGATVDAELKWEQTTIEVHTGPNDQMAVAHFKYQNPGTSPVRFKSVKPACGCTTVQTQAEAVPPGEKGEITARLNIGDRTGVQEKTIAVETDDPIHPSTVLTIKAVIPQPLEVAPTFLFWQGGEQPKAKTVKVKVAKDWGFPVRALKVSSSNWDFQTNVQKISDHEFKVDVQPRDTSRATAATVTIEIENSTRKFPVNLRVMGSGSPENLLSDPSSQPTEDLLKNPFSDPAPDSPGGH